MTILVVCGMGLGSSHFLLMETIKIIQKHELEATVDNCDVFTAQSTDADIFIGADYIVGLIEQEGIKIGLEDILSSEELETKLLETLEGMDGTI